MKGFILFFMKVSVAFGFLSKKTNIHLCKDQLAAHLCQTFLIAKTKQKRTFIPLSAHLAVSVHQTAFWV